MIGTAKSGVAREKRPSAKSSRRTSFRDEVVATHREIFRRNQVRINESVFGYTPAFKSYEREYQRAVRTYERRATALELDAAVAKARIVYVGDYHTLPQAQRSFLRLVRRLPDDRPAVLALELFGKYQREIDAYVDGKLSEKSFVKAVAPDAQWEVTGWPNLRELFELARKRGYRVIGIDASRRGAAGASLEARDRYAARVISRSLSDHPDGLVMVLIGELHIAPAHLPAQVDKQLRSKNPPQRLLIYQNCEQIYWQLERRGLEQETEIVRVRKQEYCLMNTPPIVCQQSFLNWLDVDEGIPELAAPEQNFKEYARVVASFFNLPIGDAVDEVEVASVVDLSFLQTLRSRGDFSNRDMRELKKQILRSESYYIPRARMVYLGNLSVNHASEEATHFIRHVCANNTEPKLLVDAFYARCLEEAIGFLGSKLINHKRKCADLPHFERILRSRHARPGERELGRFVLMHARAERGERVPGLAKIFETDADMFNAVTHVLGYRLGNKLYYALVRGQIDKAEIRALFFDPWDDEGAAMATYFYLASRAGGIKLPEQL